MSGISYRSGNEGPRHDPYGYEEYTVKFADRTIIVHDSGLMPWIQVDNGPRDKIFDSGEFHNRVVELTGMTPQQIERAYLKANPVNPTKCRRCDSKKIEWKEGYPGESMAFCTKCGDCVATHFNESAII